MSIHLDVGIRSAEQTPVARLERLMAEAAEIALDVDVQGAMTALGALESIRAALWQRALAAPPAPKPGDRLLSAKEAAAILNVPEKAMYRESWPFAVKVSEGRVRFSERGIQQYIRARQGRP